MPTRCYMTFPASGVKAGTDNILHAVANYLVGKFPQRVIRAVHVDTRDKVKDFYNNALQGYAGKIGNGSSEAVQEIVKIPRPHLYVGYTFDAGFDTDETGLGVSQPWNYPNAYYLDENLASAMPVFKDKDRDITLSTYNLRIRTTAEFLFTCQSKEEQTTIYVYLKNFIKDMYLHVLKGIDTDFVMPNAIICALKNLLYGSSTPMKDVAADYDKYLSDKSLGAIKPVYRNGKAEDKWYELDYLYNRIDFKISGKPQIDDGDKKDLAYDNYTIRFPAVVEYYVPINYVLTTPTLIPGAVGGVSKVEDTMPIDTVTDKNCDIDYLPVIKKYKEEARRCHLDSGFKLVARDEFALADKEDYYDIRMCMSDSDMKIFDSLTLDQRKECYKILMFEDDVLLDEGKFYTIDDNFVIYIHDGNILKNQMIEIYINVNLAKMYLDQNIRINPKK